MVAYDLFFAARHELIYSCLTFCSFFRVSENMPLYDILNEFQKGHSHIAVVFKDLNETKEAQNKTKDGALQVSMKRGEDVSSNNIRI